MDGVVEPVKVTTVACPQRVEGLITFLVDEGTWVEEGDTLCVLESVGLQSEYENGLLILQQYEMELVKLLASNKMNNALLESQFLTNEAENKIASLDSLQLKYMPPAQRKIRELELEVVALQRKKLEQKLKVTPVIQRTEVSRLNAQIQYIKRHLEEGEEMLASLTILAPRKGLAMRAESVFSSEKLKVGDNVWNGLSVIIMPDMEKMKVKIFAPESDFNAINEKDSVTYIFDAMPDSRAFGRITKKSKTWKPIARGSNVKVYDIEASLDSLTAMPDPGFTVTCNILLRELKDTVFIPQIALFSEDSIKAVYVKDKKGFEMRQVVTGLSSNKEVVIAAGLSGGEEIAFIRPKESQVTDRVLLPDSVVRKYEKGVGDSAAQQEKKDSIKSGNGGVNGGHGNGRGGDGSAAVGGRDSGSGNANTGNTGGRTGGGPDGGTNGGARGNRSNANRTINN